MRLITTLSLLATAILSVSCVTNVTRECAWVKPITVSVRDVITRETAEQIVAHNRKTALCP